MTSEEYKLEAQRCRDFSDLNYKLARLKVFKKKLTHDTETIERGLKKSFSEHTFSQEDFKLMQQTLWSITHRQIMELEAKIESL